ncbi:hypothetical protein L6164_029001 [Bauhinia variegata]|uniref:Uncharacterized protein n=1 Tax=Bauhinia variegata TaxID=167791 RepID=A0ACB9L8L0_BAUVA|nr:hypothetical protein L6164_029001 [Bauhinia variegata]
MSPESQSEKKLIILKSNDGETFEVEVAAAEQSVTLKDLIEHGCAGDAIPLANVLGEVLAKVIEYCEKHVEYSGKDKKDISRNKNGKSGNDRRGIQEWEKKFVEVDQSMLIELVMAADYLNIQSLMHLTLATLADMIIGKTPEEIRATFNIKNDYTPEEEEQVRKENSWAFKRETKLSSHYNSNAYNNHRVHVNSNL